MSYVLELSIDMLPKSLNRALRSNRWTNNKSNKAWDNTIELLCMGKKPEIPLTKAEIFITRHFWRSLDYDGLVGSMKPVVDALVTAQILIDDSWEVTGKWNVDQKFRSKKDGPLLEVKIIGH